MFVIDEFRFSIISAYQDRNGEILTKFTELNDNDIAKMIIKYGKNSLTPSNIGLCGMSSLFAGRSSFIVDLYEANKPAALELINFSFLTTDTMYELMESDINCDFLDVLDPTETFLFETIREALRLYLCTNSYISSHTIKRVLKFTNYKSTGDEFEDMLLDADKTELINFLKCVEYEYGGDDV